VGCGTHGDDPQPGPALPALGSRVAFAFPMAEQIGSVVMGLFFSVLLGPVVCVGNIVGNIESRGTSIKYR